MLHFSTTHSLAPGAPVYNFTVDMVYATQVELSWLPPDPQLWNGRITNYTVVYELLGPVGMMSANSSHPIMMKTIPNQGKPLVNNADPRCASVPLQREILVIDDLQEDHVYKFSVFMTNAAGRSGISMSIIQALLGAGRFGENVALCKTREYLVLFMMETMGGSFLATRQCIFKFNTLCTYN